MSPPQPAPSPDPGAIVYVCGDRHRYTLDEWFLHPPQASEPRVALLAYEAVRPGMPLVAATYVFTDVDRLDRAAMRRAVELAHRVRDAGPGHAVANWPNTVRNRVELLRLLADAGVNDFRCHRFVDGRPRPRYPVFLRSPEHYGPATGLLADDAGLRGAVRALLDRGWRREEILIVEYQPTDRVAGGFVKYSCYVAAGAAFAAHVSVSAGWLSKGRDRIWNEEVAQIEETFLRTNPHRAEVARIARLARIDWGRIDYGIHEGRLQVWEINTNPHLVTAATRADTRRYQRIVLPWHLPAVRAAFGRLAGMARAGGWTGATNATDPIAGPGPVVAPVTA